MATEVFDKKKGSNNDLTGSESEDANQYLTFIMNGEEYGVDILCVQEIRGWEDSTPLPNSPPQIKGVINLRGTIVPIVDLRQCFGLQAIEYTAVTVVIVLKVESEDADRVMGIVVDAVSDVYSVSENDMRPAPDLGGKLESQFIKGLVTVNESMVILLEIANLLSLDELPSLAAFKEQIVTA